jgi:acetolactate synthase I/II/III large subunit
LEDPSFRRVESRSPVRRPLQVARQRDTYCGTNAADIDGIALNDQHWAKVLSISGDGGFLFSAMELETAARLKANIIHMVWIDGTYDMVRTQEVQKYGRPSGIELGPVDVVKYAEAFGAKGMMIRSPEEITPVLKRALENRNGPVLIGVHVDYSDNHELFEMVHADRFQ